MMIKIKKLLLSVPILMCLCAPSALWAQENENPLLLAYQKSFARGSLSTKIQVLQDASQGGAEEMGPLYQQALAFVLDNIRMLKDDSAAQELAVLSVNLIGISEYRPAAGMLWDLFESSDTSRIRIAIMSTLGIVAQGESELITRMNTWMAAQNNAMRNGGNVDRQVVAECVVALGKIGNETSFGLLFSASFLGYSDDISYKADRGMEQLEDDYLANITKVIEQNPPPEKLAALRRSAEKEDAEVEVKARIAMNALDYALNSRVADDDGKAQLRELRYLAVRQLSDYRWSEASTSMIEHFDQTLVEYSDGVTSLSSLLEAIAGLGSMETHEAAVRLSLYLEVLNAYVENGRPVDTQLALSVVNNLGELGDRVAFDYLLYTGYLDYAPPVKRAAREALNKLKQ